MKQQITAEQLGELPPEALQALGEWAQQRGYQVSLTIGQMIEFLDDHTDRGRLLMTISNRPGHWAIFGFWARQPPFRQVQSRAGLCDGLWGAVRAVLQENIEDASGDDDGMWWQVICIV